MIGSLAQTREIQPNTSSIHGVVQPSAPYMDDDGLPPAYEGVVRKNSHN